MTRISINTNCRLAIGMLMGLAAVAQARAEDFGVARVSDRTRAVVRAQSPELTVAPPTELQSIPAVQLTDCEEPDDDDLEECSRPAPQSCPVDAGQVVSSHTTSEGLTPGLHYSVSCPEHGGVYDDGCPKCRYFAGFGHGDWTLDAHGNPVWCGPTPFNWNLGQQCGQFLHGLGDKFCRGLRRCDKRLGKILQGEGQPLFGHYQIVYPVNPWYFDGRDGQVFAAEQYGGPVSVPLAPVVYQQYNYGWGVPSSRITPVSRPLPLGGRP
ncbi:MAG: hypothetical protein U0992_08035 [Planctomycetaceae bacterium]